MRTNYSSKNIVLAVAGDVSARKLQKLVLSYCRKLNKGKCNEFLTYVNKQKRPFIKLKNKKIEQTHMAIGFKACSRLDPEKYKARLLSIIVGGNMSSRLFQKIREKYGLAYAVNAHLNQYIDTGSFEIQTGIKNKNVCKAVQLIMKELKKIKQYGITAEELKMAKEYIIGQTVLSMENTKSSMIKIGENMITLNRVVSLDETLDQIKKVKIEDIQEIACRFFSPHNISLAMIGDCPDKKFILETIECLQ